MVEPRKCQCEASGCEEHWLQAPATYTESWRRRKRCEPCKAGDHHPHRPKTVAPPGEAKGW